MRRLLQRASPGLWAGLTLMTNPAATHAPAASVAGWPAIQPLHVEYHYARPDQPGEDVPYQVYILDAKGNKIYRLECHRGGYHDDGYDMDFSGDFQCVLFPFKGETVSAFNLLATDTKAEQSHDWWNRGRVLAKQLQGECLDYPEYSTLRHFRLRGLRLTLGIINVVWEGSVLKQFTLQVVAAPDVDARSPMAEAAAGDFPPSSCYPGPKPK